MQKLLSVEQVAALLHISPATARLRISRGDTMPPSFRTGRRRLFLEQSVTEWLLAQASGTASELVQAEQVQAAGTPDENSGSLA